MSYKQVKHGAAIKCASLSRFEILDPLFDVDKMQIREYVRNRVEVGHVSQVGRAL
jgi:hypothetical protein